MIAYSDTQDSYLYFEMFVNGLPVYPVAPGDPAENCYLDSSAHSVIQRLRSTYSTAPSREIE